MKKAALHKLVSNISMVTDIFSPSEENVDSILDWIMPDLDPEELANALRYYYKYLDTRHDTPDGRVAYDENLKAYFDPLPELFSKYTFIQKHMTLTIKVGRRWWVYIQDYVKNPRYVIEKVCAKNPKIKTMLNTPLGEAYITYYTDRLYTFFELYFWKFPRYHINCGGLILYGLVEKSTNSWGFYCRRCHAPFSIADIDTFTYQRRLNPVKNTKKK